MKQKMLFLALIGAILAPQTLHAKACVNPVTVVCPQISCSSNVVYISQANVGPGGYTIDTPGVYCLIEDITWAPPATVTLNRAVPGPSSPIAAITITSSNVLLNLNGYTLQQSGDASYAVGIYVTNGTDPSSVTDIGTPLNNIIIKNGTIQNIATAGMLVNKVNEFLLEDLYVVRNGYSGYIQCPCGAHRAGGIEYVSFISSQTAPFLNNHSWRNVHCDSNNSTYGDPAFAIYGGTISAVNQVIVENCTFDNNISSISPEGGVIGLEVLNNTNVTIVKSEACNNTSIGAVGFSISGSSMQLVVSECTANGNTIFGDGSAVVPPPPPILNILTAYGFAVSSDNHDVGPATGITFSNCVANNQTSTVTGFTGHKIHAYGFYFEFVQDVQVDHCIACLNVALPSAPSLPLGDGEGFYIDGYDVTLTNCRAEYNQGNAGPYSNSIQYDLYPYNAGIAYNNNLINCVAIGNPDDPQGIGIYTYAANNCVIEGCLIESNVYDGILFDTGSPYPDCPYTAQNVVKHNQILAPNPFIFGGPTGRWAIEDISSASGPNAPVNTYYDNYALNYPGDNGLFTNYSTGVREAGNAIANPGNSFITQWFIPGDPPSYTGVTKLTNLDITYGSCEND